jgi:hypothetical protein
MFTSLSEQIEEEFSSFQSPEWTLRDSNELEFRNEEIDPQMWQSHIQMSRPMANLHAVTEPTCLRVRTVAWRWKNQYGEGTSLAFAVTMASSWSEADYEEMANKNCGRYRIDNCPNPLPPKREPPEGWDEVEFAETKIPEPKAPSTPTVRIQLTVRVNGEYMPGMGKESADNIQVHGASIAAVIAALRPLDSLPKVRRPARGVRVQIQNLLGGSMQGGGNFQVHMRSVPEIAQEVRILLDAAGLYTVGAVSGMRKTAESKGNGTARASQSEDGSRKPAKPLPISAGGGGQTQHTEKDGNARASLMADLMQMIEG